MKKFVCLLVCFSSALWAQRPEKLNAADIYQGLQKLSKTTTVLYVAAHPDDENTRLISYFANAKHYRTAYLSLTRGDGGQNLIGSQLRDQLGMIRTQELLEARKIDGGEQYFTRANDFGFSKNPTETLAKWNEQGVLSDMVWIIRKLQPEIIINRFDHRTPGTTHGHHTASAQLSLKAFDLAADPAAFPEQLQYVGVWQAKQLFFNTSWWFYGSQEKFAAADKSNLTEIDLGTFLPLEGKSIQEIAALSRSCHKSQGFGSSGSRGSEKEYLEFIKGDKAFQINDWNGVSERDNILKICNDLIAQFDFKNPSASVPKLLELRSRFNTLPESGFRTYKLQELDKLILASCGFYMEVVTNSARMSPGTAFEASLEVINRSEIPVVLNTISVESQLVTKLDFLLKPNVGYKEKLKLRLEKDLPYTTPYYINANKTDGMFAVGNQLDRGLPEKNPAVIVNVTLGIENQTISIKTPVVFKTTDDVKGEIFQPLLVSPQLDVAFAQTSLLVKAGKKQRIELAVIPSSDLSETTVRLQAPENWKVTPEFIALRDLKTGQKQTVFFEVTPQKTADTVLLTAVVGDNNETALHRTALEFDHIYHQQLIAPAHCKLVVADIDISAKKIGYIPGAGDEVAEYLKQLQTEIVVLDPKKITKESLSTFDAIITGIRAYNVNKDLVGIHTLLLDFVQSGKTLLVQYNTLDDLVLKDFTPYPLTIGRERVTEEDSAVSFIDPQAKALNKPNKLTQNDFLNWKQERGLYFPSKWDEKYQTVLSMADTGETQKTSGLLIAPYGKGHYIYCGISFFRQLPEGVTGAYKLLANLLSVSK
ncbi:PIG-L family deacetylase [Flavobacterium sp.]|uniref:PIG-L family deacetylase n=1 Tax=Flavobacterium sp. TaxID=239 RepID=UPI0026329830|nr:PIG-L family deacetylase [Flavobacterium sp.]